eukprot:COSAG06_NODE_469_length_15336_cov_3778.639890_12_plen_191_part_00
MRQDNALKRQRTQAVRAQRAADAIDLLAKSENWQIPHPTRIGSRIVIAYNRWSTRRHAALGKVAHFLNCVIADRKTIGTPFASLSLAEGDKRDGCFPLSRASLLLPTPFLALALDTQPHFVILFPNNLCILSRTAAVRSPGYPRRPDRRGPRRPYHRAQSRPCRRGQSRAFRSRRRFCQCGVLHVDPCCA